MNCLLKRSLALLLTLVMLFACVPIFGANSTPLIQGSITASAAEHRHKKVTTTTKKATLSNDGQKVVRCTVCKKTLSKIAIARISLIKLSKTTLTYTGKTLIPSVTVKDSKGKALKAGTDYTVSYKNNKSPGKATATVTFKGSYSGKKTLSFRIIPKLSVQKTNSSLSFSWTKVSGAVRYKASLCYGKTLIKAFDTTKTSAKFTNLKEKTNYKLIVIAYNSRGKRLLNAEYTAKTLEKSPYSKVKLGVILLHDEHSTYDLNFIEAVKKACNKLDVKYKILTNISEDNSCYNAASRLVKDGCNIIFADSYGHESFLIEAAKDYPNVEFCHASGVNAHTAGLKNYHNAYASIYEGRYLSGVAAGLKIKEMIANGIISKRNAKLGYVAPYEYAEVVSDYTAFFLGAKAIVPSVKMEVRFTRSWFDIELEREAANVLIDRNCALISQHSDSLGAPYACEKSGVPNIAYNINYNSQCPTTSITSSKINWTPYFEYILTQKATGKRIKTDWVGNLKTGSVEITGINERVAATGTKAKLKQVKADLIAGKIHVFDTNTFTVSGKKVNYYFADVDPDFNFSKDTQVVFDGYFHECEMRSAPYFDLMIDGITLLNT